MSEIEYPRVQGGGHRISESVVHSIDHSACVVSWPEFPDLGRCLLIQETDMSHVHIRLRDDVSNEEALLHVAKLLQAIAAPPEPYEPEEPFDLEQYRLENQRANETERR